MAELNEIAQDLKAGVKIFKALERASVAVDALLEKKQAADDLQKLYLENREKADQAQAVLEKYQTEGENAKAQAQKIIDDAKAEASKLVEKAKAEAADQKAEIDCYREKAVSDVTELEKQKARLVADVKTETESLEALRGQASELKDAVDGYKEQVKKTLGGI